MADEEKEPTSRVTMIWPETLKEAVREKVGARGLTDFAIKAVEAKLGIHDEHKADSKELNEVRFLAQRLADAIALGGDYMDHEQILREMELPAWIDTTGWPAHLAATVKPEDSTPEPVNSPELKIEEVQSPADPIEISGKPKVGKSWYKASDGGWTGDPAQAKQPLETVPPVTEEDDEDLHRPMALVKPKAPEGPAIGDPGTVRSAESLPHDRPNDLLDRLRAKAAEKGVDISGIDLKPASAVEQPREKEVAGADPSSSAGASEALGKEQPPVTEPEQPKPFHEERAERGLEPVDMPTCPQHPDVAIAPGGFCGKCEAPNPNACPNCGAEMVNGECWECF